MMFPTITQDMHDRLEEIGLDEEEITILTYVHQLKGKDVLLKIRECVREYCFQRLMEEATATWQRQQWNEEQTFEIVEQYRRTKR